MSSHFEHEGFFCSATRCWHASISELEPGELKAAFTDFTRRFPDHASDVNTSIYLGYLGDGDVSPPMWTTYWYCSHFEHFSRDDLVQLVEFLDVLGRLSEWKDCCCSGVENLDCAAERVQLVVHDPREEIRSEILSRGRELIAVRDFL